MDVAAVVISIGALVVSIGAAVLTAVGVDYQRRTHRDTTRRAKETTMAVYYTLEQIVRRVSHEPVLGYDEGLASCQMRVSDTFLPPGRSVEIELQWRFEEPSVVEVSCAVVPPVGPIWRVPVVGAKTHTIRCPDGFLGAFPEASTTQLGRYEVQWYGSGPEMDGVLLGVTSFLVGPFE